ncbi:hypothetical protein SLS62_002559 [Diatrype stigma]|uniref:Protein kinase domain-containing protein n=1 Tax=Diatrype stigma TaxID=117547 RepID=A0AAN9V881_9PEZI
MPQSPAKTKSWWNPKGYFTDKEAKIIVNSVIRDDPQKGGMYNRQGLSVKQIWHCAKDYDMWPLYALGLLFGIPKYPVSQYLTLSFRSLGFNVIQTNLLSIPNIVGSSITMLLITAFSELLVQYPATYFYYRWRNNSKAKKWDVMTPEEQENYRQTTTDEGNKRRYVNRIQRYFNNAQREFVFIHPAHLGQDSVFVLLAERVPNPRMREERRFLVKRTFREQAGSDDDEQLRKEVEITNSMHGQPHIAQAIYFDLRLTPDPLYGLSRPSLVIEYVENGTLDRMRNQMIANHVAMPNRVALGFFFCLVIGGFHPLEGEHVHVPILKLIDFGRSYIHPDPDNINAGVKQNIYDIGRIMRMMMDRDDEPDPWAAPVTMNINGNMQTFMSGAATLNRRGSTLDYNLKELVMRCQAVDPKMRPELHELLGELEKNAALKGSEKWYHDHRYWNWRAERQRDMASFLSLTIFWGWGFGIDFDDLQFPST